ncbi:hypothetical protein GCM10025863_29820 [Microbacterium suwonense]|uniref:Aldehyde dehydrogenase domain-containing protein n=1 Tax=Microbacterium suwonense TaxID=683047 RepID=A0ABN6X8H3_9MICO|nr:hypothetical protein GCM10025863_29820 [Microbacterium suwonense]
MTITDTAIRTTGHWIEGAEQVPEGARTAPVFNPATGEVTSHLALADESVIDLAIRTAQRGFEEWSGYSIAKRQTVLFAFRELLNARRDELAAIITAEHGKVLSDAMGEILRGQEVVELACGFPHLTKGSSARTPRRVSMCTRSSRRWVWWASSARSTSRRWCRCGSSPWRSPPATR